MSIKQIKIHFKDTWKDLSTGEIQDVEYSTETIHVYPGDDVESNVKVVMSTAGVSVLYGIEHTREVLGKDDISDNHVVLSKDQMFDFILENKVTLTPDGSVWQKTDGKKVVKKYNVSINEANMSGYDLEEAITEYVKRQRERNK